MDQLKRVASWRLEPFTSNDFADYWKLVGNAQVMAMITERALSMEEARAEFQVVLARNAARPGFGNFRILDAETGAFIGLAKLEIAPEQASQAELGYMLLPEYWGQGLAGKVARQLMDKARSSTGLIEVVAIIDPTNEASRKILLNNGLVSKVFKDFNGLPGEILHLVL